MGKAFPEGEKSGCGRNILAKKKNRKAGFQIGESKEQEELHFVGSYGKTVLCPPPILQNSEHLAPLSHPGPATALLALHWCCCWRALCCTYTSVCSPPAPLAFHLEVDKAHMLSVFSIPEPTSGTQP